MPTDICQQMTIWCDKGPWSTGKGQLTLLDLLVAVGTEQSEGYALRYGSSKYKTVNHLF